MSLPRAAFVPRLLLAAALLACGGMSAPASAGAGAAAHLRIAVVPPSDADRALAGSRWTIYLDGYMDPASASRLVEVVARQRIKDASVYLNSPGGSLIAGMAIGRLLREQGFETNVGTRTADPLRPSQGVCYSACPFAYAGGVRRSLVDGSVLGVHRAANRVPVPDEAAFERRVQADATAYLVEMGVSPQLVTLMVQVSPGTIRLLNQDETIALGLVNSEAAELAAERAAGAQR